MPERSGGLEGALQPAARSLEPSFETPPRLGIEVCGLECPVASFAAELPKNCIEPGTSPRSARYARARPGNGLAARAPDTVSGVACSHVARWRMWL
ncbi:hypothetical protein CIW48_25585 [Methylobacterium sp. P1-11]|nr:hypothetical protein CIW48_25585 [Methylobacterium sp. P1-11]